MDACGDISSKLGPFLHPIRRVGWHDVSEVPMPSDSRVVCVWMRSLFGRPSADLF